ncbi:MAG: alcohol dehydrogenase catalytic domain-containing protein [Ardenticatenaceae bacterium]|nr:alcohol dehydrogenase catalytic domain-containing protein [Ardenticatenaceae bacterium]
MKTRAAVLYDAGLPAPYTESEPLKVQEVELEGPGTGEVLVELVSAGLCHSDLSVIDGARPRALPVVLGHEAAGIVCEIGPGVRDVQVNDHVIFALTPMCGRCSYCIEGRPNLCENGGRANAAGSLLSGKRHFRDSAGRELHYHLGISAFSHYTVVAQESLVRIPSEVPLEKAALFGCAIQTGVGAVLNTAGVTPGNAVAVFRGFDDLAQGKAVRQIVHFAR